MDDLGIEVAFVTSERLYDDQRDVIERVFGCRVANGYGGRDAGFIAHACPQGGMHITAEDIIVEVIGTDGHAVGSEASGEIVVTHLATADYPFIRYRTGDFGILDSRACSCGRGLPLLKEIQGRTTDFVVAADGTLMHGLAVVYPIRDLAGIEAFKVIQETRTRTRVQIVPNHGIRPARDGQHHCRDQGPTGADGRSHRRTRSRASARTLGQVSLRAKSGDGGASCVTSWWSPSCSRCPSWR